MSTLPHDWASHGAYTPSQAASLLGVSTAKVRRWAYGTENAAAAIIAQYPQHGGELLTFIDFVQLLAIRAIRDQKQVSLQKIRKTVEKARKRGIDFPFAKRHRTFVFYDDVVLRLDNGDLIQVTGKYRESKLIEPIVYDYLEDIGFDARGLASEYRPVRKAHRSVLLSPHVNYGAPTVMPCRYTVSTLLAAIDAEGSPRSAAAACGVNPIDIELAVEYKKKIAA